MLLEQATTRKQKMAEREKMRNGDDNKRLTKEERLEMTNAKLDSQIAMKKEMKSILTAEQYEKWTKMEANRNQKGKGKIGRKMKN